MFSLKELVSDSAASRDQAAELHALLCNMFQQVAERPLGGLNAVTEHVKDSRTPLQDARHDLDNCRLKLKDTSTDVEDAKATVQALKQPHTAFLQAPTRAVDACLQLVREVQKIH
ncbi:hypothetical protein WJX74_001607 [Apatococcus lobatus]|uniref:Uncharacterized protein n=2 Tax=Apatococcus TaxID=904362 RepID=A0AAW1T915_9CHLO